MGRIGTQHREVNELGIGKCSVPMWMNGCPAGFCDKDAYGEPPPRQEYRNRFTGRWEPIDGGYGGYVPALACPNHGGPKVRLFMDGDQWCAVYADFVGLMASPSGFGPTKEKAAAALGKDTWKG